MMGGSGGSGGGGGGIWDMMCSKVQSGSVTEAEQQRVWEQVGAFNGHPSHPMSKVGRAILSIHSLHACTICLDGKAPSPPHCASIPLEPVLLNQFCYSLF